jgi:Bacterial pre-peptidase C-terminal domain
MDALKLKVTLILLAAFCLAVPAQAQSAVLSLLSPVNASVPPNGTNTWTFNAVSGAVVSFKLEATSQDFDPQMVLTDSGGREIDSSDDYDYPNNPNPLLEAITIPYTDTYTLTVSGFNNTFGTYTLTMLPGYSTLSYQDDFSSSAWSSTDTGLSVTQTQRQLQTALDLPAGFAAAFDDSAPTFNDFFAQVQVNNITSTSGWLVGLAFRRQGNIYYLLSINDTGSWRLTLVTNDQEHVIRDWAPHPNIIPGATDFSIGVLAKGVGFDFFFDSGYIGSAIDSTITTPGQIGLMAGEPIVGANFSNLLVTTPLEVDGAYVIPQEVLAGDGPTMVQALKRNHVVSAAGEMSLTLLDSSVQFSHPGVNRVMLGRGVRYTNFALGANVTLITAADGPAGCGLVARLTSDLDYTLAYFDQAGEYGISVRSGDVFKPGLYGVDRSIVAGQHHLLLIANDNKLYYYIDRKLVGTQDNAPQNGEVGIAVVNFESNMTNCQYTNLWLWRWN